MQWDDDTANPSAVPSVKSAARVLDLLDDIAANGPATRAELSLRMDIPRSSIHAVLRTMTARGWLELDRTGGTYRLGFPSMVLSSAFLASDPTVRRAAPLLDRLAAVTGETVHLGRLHGEDVFVVDKREASRPARMSSDVGRSLPAYCTSMGRAVLATRPVATRARLVPDVIVPLTPHTTTDRDAVLAVIDRAAALGYAVESEEACEGVRCFGVALPSTGTAVHAVSVAVPIGRLDSAREAAITEVLLRLVRRPARRSGRSACNHAVVSPPIAQSVHIRGRSTMFVRHSGRTS